MQTRNPFVERLAAEWPPRQWRDVTVILAVSGGADSVALFRGIHSLATGNSASRLGRVAVGHFNHGLRGAESDADEAFVRDLCRQYGTPCEVGLAQDRSARNGGHSEAASRAARYRFFRKLADRLGARYIATAHTANDQAETILHRIIRGTGVKGLAGIPGSRQLSELTTVVRPLLKTDRQSILRYLQEIGQDFRIDSSNHRCTFTRNRIRHQLMPQLAREYNPQVSQALVRLGLLARQAQELFDRWVEPLLDRCLTGSADGGTTVDCRPLRDQPPYLIREFLLAVWKRKRWPLQEMSQEKWAQLADLVRGGGLTPARLTLPSNVSAELRGAVLVLTPGNSSPNDAAHPERK